MCCVLAFCSPKSTYWSIWGLNSYSLFQRWKFGCNSSKIILCQLPVSSLQSEVCFHFVRSLELYGQGRLLHITDWDNWVCRRVVWREFFFSKWSELNKDSKERINMHYVICTPRPCCVLGESCICWGLLISPHISL